MHSTTRFVLSFVHIPNVVWKSSLPQCKCNHRFITRKLYAIFFMIPKPLRLLYDKCYVAFGFPLEAVGPGFLAGFGAAVEDD
jgi:hypothetical protein